MTGPEAAGPPIYRSVSLTHLHSDCAYTPLWRPNRREERRLPTRAQRRGRGSSSRRRSRLEAGRPSRLRLGARLDPPPLPKLPPAVFLLFPFKLGRRWGWFFKRGLD